MGTTRNLRDRSCIPGGRLFGEVTPGPNPTLERRRRSVTWPAIGGRLRSYHSHMVSDPTDPNGSTMLVLHGSAADLQAALTSGLSADDEQTPRGSILLWAAEWGRSDLIEVLIENGARREPLALNLAASKNHQVAAKLLLDLGWDPNKEVAGWTPLQAAADHLSPEMVAMLIEAGADPSPRTNDPAHPQWHDLTASELARQRGGAKADEIERLIGDHSG